MDNVDLRIHRLERTAPGRFALATLRLAGKLPGAAWDEMVTYLRAHPEALASAERIERGLLESDVEVQDRFGDPAVTGTSER